MAASTWWKDESGTCARTCRELSVMPGASAAARPRRAAPRDKAAGRGGRFLAYWAEIGLWPPPRHRAKTKKKAIRGTAREARTPGRAAGGAAGGRGGGGG